MKNIGNMRVDSPIMDTNSVAVNPKLSLKGAFSPNSTLYVTAACLIPISVPRDAYLGEYGMGSGCIDHSVHVSLATHMESDMTVKEV